MTFALRLSALLLVSLSTAWAAPFLKQRPDVTCDLTDAASSGLVLVSASAPVVESATDPTNIWFHFNRVGRSSFSDEKILIAREQFIKDVPNDFDGPFGRLYALQLPAGDYEFKTWTFTQARPGERTVVHSPRKSVARLPFKVAAGRVIYLGSFSPSKISDYELSMTIVDQNQRDTQVFTRKCPNIDASKIDLQPLKTGLWD